MSAEFGDHLGAGRRVVRAQGVAQSDLLAESFE
jgi:hypothetical protein